MKILANDGIAADGKIILEKAGFTVITEKVPQDKLHEVIGGYDVLIVRSATKVNKQVMENPGNLKLVVRAGVGLDNVDAEFAKSKGIDVANTPNSSTLSVAELVFAHLSGAVRFLYDANRQMPANGKNEFNALKKKYSDGRELRGKTLGIFGFGRIGQEVGKIAISLGMKVLAYDPYVKSAKLVFSHLPFTPTPEVEIITGAFEEVLSESDFITLHLPHTAGNPALIGEEELNRMKNKAGIVNAARGGVIDEKKLLKALESGKISFAALDVFENEPDVDEGLLQNVNVSLSPHIAASTLEGQERIGLEVAKVIIDRLKN